MSILLFISFILHGLTIYWLFLLRAKNQNATASLKDERRIVEEVEGMFASYLMEMKDENEKLLAAIEEYKHQQPEVKQMNVDIPNIPSETETLSHKEISNLSEEEGNKYLYEPPESLDAETYQQSFEAQVMHMKKQGMSAEEIAKTLNRGKTEIELLLKFQRETDN